MTPEGSTFQFNATTKLVLGQITLHFRSYAQGQTEDRPSILQISKTNMFVRATGTKLCILTSLGKEARVDILECFFVYRPTGTLLQQTRVSMFWCKLTDFTDLKLLSGILRKERSHSVSVSVLLCFLEKEIVWLGDLFKGTSQAHNGNWTAIPDL